MKIKLDENLGRAVALLFRESGYDVETVRQEGLSGATDQQLIQVCQAEKRCLVTLDLDFSNPLVFNPSDYSGIVVLRVPPNPAYQDFIEFSKNLLSKLTDNSIDGNLWIVQRNQIRIYKPD
ncbi:MAG: DUF5615 family PIN-like protein [Candidatus Hinthialibacter antarcticus]|nr:DUF5615 family PIN-like protein [Candidatus Hinthialibacter antarcticus]